jgi:RNA polymerase sigma-70 factor (ECF subfamily)
MSVTVRPLQSERLPSHLDRLYRAAWALCGSPHDAEDLVQETMARVLARPRRLRRREEYPYLVGALRNVYLTTLRSANRRPRIVDLPLHGNEWMRSGRAEPDQALEHKALLDAIDELPRDSREALVAVDVVGLSYREAARGLGTREGTLTTRVFRARQRLARALDGSLGG